MFAPIDQVQFTDADFIRDPYPAFHAWREKTPIYFREDWSLWFITSYEDVIFLLKDRRLGRMPPAEAHSEGSFQGKLKAKYPDFWAFHNNNLMEKEPPDHSRLKSLLQGEFSPRKIAELRPKANQIAYRLIEQTSGQKSVDLVKDLAAPLSIAMISVLLGIPEDQRGELRSWSNRIVQMYEINPGTEAAQSAESAVGEFNRFLGDIVTHKRKRPGDDLLTALIQFADLGRLSFAELIANSILLLNAGHEATINAFANGVLALINNPFEVERLLKNPEYLASAVEEILRYDGPLQLFKRWAREDLDYKGHHFAKGSVFALFYGAANRDPARFYEPDHFDITRVENPHLGFGTGIHYCLGAPLARIELQEAIRELFQAFPQIELAKPNLVYKPSFVIRGLERLPVRLGPHAGNWGIHV